MGSKIGYVNEEKTVQPNKMEANKCDINTEFLLGATIVITRHGHQET
jgi:hypothetical protein